MKKFVVFCETLKNKELLFTKGIEVGCTKCGEKIWLSDSSIEGIKNKHHIASFDDSMNLYPYCDEHWDDKEFDTAIKMPLTKEQIDEINNKH